ncbi:MAG: autotransporter outer membrane beta-barrel domain-containing protein [Rhodocyclaceae bacterium]|nr:autotransporter outer membrane beta-barrel domain-containing protein [Rhodocyclaceae bacterium]
MKNKNVSNRLKAMAITLAMAFPVQSALAQVTYFSVNSGNATTGVMNLSVSSLGGSILPISPGANPFNYATVFFVPTTSASYTFGQTAAPVDTVMILYQGVFNPASPNTGALVGNDDTSQATHRTTVGDPTLNTLCGTVNYCPQVTTTVVAGQTYSVLISTFGSGNLLGLPLSFYSTGGGGSFFATSTNVYTSSSNMRNTPALPAARVIDANGSLSGLFTGLTTDQQISNAASQTLPLLTGASMIAANSALVGINRVIQARIEGNLGMSSGESFYGNKHLWMKPFGSWADQDAQNGVAGYKAETLGLAIGVDGTVNPALRLGGAFAYAKSDINGQSTVAPQSANVDVYQLIGYGSYSLDERTDINFQVDVGQNTNKGRRQIAFTSSTASSDYGSQTTHVGVGVGRTYALSGQTNLTPSVRADYTLIKDKGYVETGAGLLNLDVKGRSAESFVIGVDGKLSHKLNDQTSLLANLGVGYDAMIKQAAITSAFAGAPGAAFVTYGIDPNPWLMRGGVGAVYQTKTNLEITGRYDAEVREKFTNQTASVKFRWAF